MTKAPVLATTATEWGHSRWETLERCPRSYELRYVKRVDSGNPMNNAAQIGIATHRGLAEYYSLMKEHRSPKHINAMIDAGPEDVFVKAEAKRLCAAYIAYWEERESFTVVDVERAVGVELKHKGRVVNFTMRLDLVIRDNSGKLILVDHKTTAANRGEFALEHAVNSQFVGSAAAWPYSEPLSAVMLNRIIRTKVPSFDRHSFIITEAEVQRWKRDHIMLDQDRRRYERAKHYPMHRSSCQGRYGLCDFYNVCHGGGQ